MNEEMLKAARFAAGVRDRKKRKNRDSVMAAAAKFPGVDLDSLIDYVLGAGLRAIRGGFASPVRVVICHAADGMSVVTDDPSAVEAFVADLRCWYSTPIERITVGRIDLVEDHPDLPGDFSRALSEAA